MSKNINEFVANRVVEYLNSENNEQRILEKHFMECAVDKELCYICANLSKDLCEECNNFVCGECVFDNTNIDKLTDRDDKVLKGDCDVGECYERCRTSDCFCDYIVCQRCVRLNKVKKGRIVLVKNGSMEDGLEYLCPLHK